MTDFSHSIVTPNTASGSDKALLALFSTTLLLSAFLLFSVQPFFAKMVLPILGGSPGVWSVAMVFFQAILLAGYAYAHLLTTHLRLTTAAMVHLGVIVAAFIVLPIAVPDGWTEPPQSGQTVWLLGLFAVAVGLPFFAVSANGPLLQAWFARTGHAHANDPYFLYGASNIGSFASLILFIVAIEPTMKVTDQSLAWTTGYALLGAAIACCAAFTLRRQRQYLETVTQTEEPDRIADATAFDRFVWVALAAAPSGLLVAVTAHISTDIAAAPFLWVVPLALFLLTFVLAFARKPWLSIKQLSVIVPVLAAFVFVTMVMSSTLPVWLTLASHLTFFFFAALLVHSVLVSRRPAARDLTQFYFYMSLGGVFGGAFTALISPFVFNWVAEYPLLIIAVLACRPAVWQADRREMRIFVLIGLLLAATMNNPVLGGALMPANPGFFTMAIAGFAIAAALAQLRSEALHILFVLLVAGLCFSMQATSGALHAERSFFGVVKALHSHDGRFTIMAHGTTEHGAMRSHETRGRPTPIAYYHESGGIAAALFAAQNKRLELPSTAAPAQIGVVGLGTGSLLCHRRENETWTSFEIDKAVVDVARDDRLFRFMSACGNGDPVILGDARLTLAKQPTGKFDYLLIDAFSSDSIPVHLLTVQAIELYRAKLKHDGILAIHISNRYMELKSVLAAQAEATGMVGRGGSFSPPEHLKKGEHVNPSKVVVLANDTAALGEIANDPRWQPLQPKGTTAWTDDYSNVLAAIIRGL